MKARTFKERLCSLILWTCITAIIYFIVCFVFVNDFSDRAKYDSNKAYNLVKDTLNFGAIIFTPLVAITFFSDWREQYVLKGLELKSQKIYEKLESVKKDLFALRIDFPFGDNDEKNNVVKNKHEIDFNFKLLTNYLIDIEKMINDFGSKEIEAEQSFMIYAKGAKESLYSCVHYVWEQYDTFSQVAEPNGYKCKGETENEFLSYCKLKRDQTNHDFILAYARYMDFENKLIKLKESFRIKV